MLGRIEGRRGHQRMRWLDGLFDVMDMNLGDDEGQGSCTPCGCIQLDMTGQLNNSNTVNEHKNYKGTVFLSSMLDAWSLYLDSNLSSYSIFFLYLKYSIRKSLSFLCKAQFEAMYILNI